MPRTFVAVEISEEVRERAVALIERLRPAAEGIKWVGRENLHLTLKFLGDVADDRIADVCRAVAEAAATRPAFEIELVGAGAFPSVKRPSNLWLGVRGPAAQLGALQAAIETAVSGLGFPREWREFTPHLTLGRVKRGVRPPRALADALRQHADYAAGRSPVPEVVVFESRLGPTGPNYLALGRGKLASGA